MLAHYCADRGDQERLLELSSKEGAERYLNLVRPAGNAGAGATLLYILLMHESCAPPLDHLVQLLSPLKARSYTLCSAPTANDRQMQIVFNLLEFGRQRADGVPLAYERNGVCTDYLSKLSAGAHFLVVKRQFNNFTFTSTPSSPLPPPLVLVGPGTGIAPFVSLLRSLRHQGDAAEQQRTVWLFYGCRDPRNDFLFKQELLDELCTPNVRLCVSFSRFNIDEDAAERATLRNAHSHGRGYVQDAIRHHRRDIVRLVHAENASVFVCGDALNMARDVQTCFGECLSAELTSDELGGGSGDANKYLLDMIKNKRYKQDIWAWICNELYQI